MASSRPTRRWTNVEPSSPCSASELPSHMKILEREDSLALPPVPQGRWVRGYGIIISDRVATVAAGEGDSDGSQHGAEGLSGAGHRVHGRGHAPGDRAFGNGDA